MMGRGLEPATDYGTPVKVSIELTPYEWVATAG